MATNEEQLSNLGSEGCKCTDQSAILASLTKRSCLISEGQNGVMLTVEGPCVPSSYGSYGCLQHDLINDPKCQMADSQDYCPDTWCYVDAESCMRSSERLHRSIYFPRDLGVNLVSISQHFFLWLTEMQNNIALTIHCYILMWSSIPTPHVICL